MKLLLISNSTNPKEDYLAWPQEFIHKFLLDNKIKSILFVPYAGVSVGKDPKTLQESYNNYEEKVAAVFSKFGVTLQSIHHENNPIEAAKAAECIVVGGGNTFHLVYELHKNKLMEVIRQRALKGMPFIGWSAGSNIACPTLRTTNDMPIIEPESFNCLNLVPFQINPHYLDDNKHPEEHGGEKRSGRINEFLAVNKEVTVVGLREASLIEVDGDRMELKGRHGMRVFQYGKNPIEKVQGNVSELLI